MQTFQFLFCTYQLEAPIFLREVTPDVLTAAPCCGSLQNDLVTHTPT